MKKGFTLIELMALILIITLIAIFVFPNIVNQIKKSKDATSDSVEDVVISAAKRYINDNPNTFEENGSNYCITIKDLVDNDYLKEDIVNDSENGVLDKFVSVENNNEYKIVNECSNDEV